MPPLSHALGRRTSNSRLKTITSLSSKTGRALCNHGSTRWRGLLRRWRIWATRLTEKKFCDSAWWLLSGADAVAIDLSSGWTLAPDSAPRHVRLQAEGPLPEQPLSRLLWLCPKPIGGGDAKALHSRRQKSQGAASHGAEIRDAVKRASPSPPAGQSRNPKSPGSPAN